MSNSHMTITAACSTIAGILAVAQIIPYIKSTLQGITQPSKVAVGISLMCNIVTVTSMYASGTMIGILLPIIFTFTNIITLTLAFRCGRSEFAKTDIINAAVAVAALGVWVAFGAEKALIAMFVAKISANMAIFTKLQRNPGTEDILSWVISEFAAVFSLTGIMLTGVLTLPVLGGPVISLLNCTMVTVLALVQRQKAGQPVHPVLTMRHAFGRLTPAVHLLTAVCLAPVAWLQDQHVSHAHLALAKQQPEFHLAA